VDDVLHFSSVIRVPGRVAGREWLIQLSRVGLNSSFTEGGDIPEAIAFITDPKQPLTLSPEVLNRTYGLTPAGARAALAATGGGAIEEIAERLMVSVNTIKTQIKQVYTKTGASGRADLVRLVMGLATTN
jgi:DNA-binding CsgD family transcriptional regulator